MALPNAKDLAKLAAVCRKAGITHFKGDGIEFTLSDEAPVTKAPKQALQAQDTKEPSNDDLPYEQLLNWSVTGYEEEKAN